MKGLNKKYPPIHGTLSIEQFEKLVDNVTLVDSQFTILTFTQIRMKQACAVRAVRERLKL